MVTVVREDNRSSYHTYAFLRRPRFRKDTVDLAHRMR